MKQPVLVCGATGRVGQTLGALLTQAGVEWRGMSRSPQPQRTGGARWVQGDFSRPDTLERCLEGVGSVFMCSADDPKQVEFETAMVRACESAGVGHVVKLSAQSAGLTPPVSFGRLHREVELALEASRMEWTVLRPTFFMQSLLHFARDIKRGRLIAPVGKGSVAMVDARDVARVAAAVLQDPRPHRSCHYVLTGPEALAFPQVAEALARVLGKDVRHISPPAWLAKLLLPLVMPRWQAQQAVELMQALGANAQAQTSQTVESLTGIAPIGLNRFVLEHAREFDGH